MQNIDPLAPIDRRIDNDDPISLQELIQGNEAESVWHRLLEIRDRNELDTLSFEQLLDILDVIGKLSSWTSDRKDRTLAIIDILRSRDLEIDACVKLAVKAAEFRCFEESDSLMEEVHALGGLAKQEDYLQLVYYRILSDVDEAMRLFRELKAERKVSTSAEAFSTFIAGFSLIADYKSCQQFFEAKKDAGFECSVEDVALLLRAHGTSRMTTYGEFKKLLEELNLFNSTDPKVIRVVIHSLCHICSNTEDVEIWIQRYQSLTGDDDIGDYLKTSLIRAYARTGQQSEAFRLFSQLQNPSDEAHSIILRSAIEEDDMTIAENIFQKAISRGFDKCQKLYAILIHGYVKHKNISSALETLENMKARGILPHVFTLTSILHGYTLVGDYAQAISLYRRMKRSTFHIDIVTCTAILSGLSHGGRFEEAYEVYEDIRRFNLELDPVAYGALIYVYGKQYNIKECQRLFSELKEKGITRNIYIYNALIYAHMNVGDLEGTMKIMDELRSDGVSPNICTYLLMMRLSGAQGRIDNLIKFFNLLVKDEQLPKIPNTSVQLLLKILSESASIDIVQKVFEAFETGFAKGKLELNDICWISYIRILQGSGLFEEAREYLVKMFKSGVQLSDRGLRHLLDSTNAHKISHPELRDEYLRIIDYYDSSNAVRLPADTEDLETLKTLRKLFPSSLRE